MSDLGVWGFIGFSNLGCGVLGFSNLGCCVLGLLV